MKQKIMYVILSLNFGGAEKVVVNTVKQLDKSTYHPIIACLDEKGELANELESLGINIRVFNRKAGLDIGLFFRIARFIINNNIDLIHTHNIEALFYAGTAAKLAKRPVVHTQHDPQLTFSLKRKIKVLLISLGVKKIVAVSKDIESVYRNSFRIRNNKLLTILNGIDTSLYPERAIVQKLKDDCNIKTADLVVGTVARFADVKDLFTLIDSFIRVYEKRKDVHLVMAGDGPLAQELKDYASKSIVSQRIHFLGYRSDIINVLSTFDIFINCSLSEGLSMTILEAMACRLPIVATAVGGNRELVENNINGKLVPTRDPSALSKAIFEIIPIKKKLGFASYYTIKDKYSLSSMVENYESIYREVLGMRQLQHSLLRL